ncbi:MAG: HAD hydrolase-like protein [Alphaproteobacteria bacterium]|nr:HAD hydrolase-like protein [Alphaproteobacteria bacterium]
MSRIRGYIFVDNDGTFMPGTETRNRLVLQSIVDEYAKAAGTPHQINWDLCAGQTEPKIHDLVTQNGFADFDNFITREAFEAAAKQGYKDRRPDFSARSEMIETLYAFKQIGIMPVLVTNSEKDVVEDALEECFEAEDLNVEDVFELIVTKTDVLERGLNPKPSPDPYHLARQLANAHFGVQVPRKHTAILEDSPTGVESGFLYAGNRDQVIQFVDITREDNRAGHHVTTMEQCTKAIISALQLPKKKILARANLFPQTTNPAP